MTTTTGPRIRAEDGFRRDTLEFARVANLADAVFAIAMTLLVLGLDVDPVTTNTLTEGLRDSVPQLLAFLLGFALVANIWWQHHKLFSRLDHLDRPLVALTVTLLAVVALVPFPTGLLGSKPTDRAAVIVFIGVFVLLSSLFIACIWRAQRSRAWTSPMPPRTFRWVIAGWAVTVAMMLIAAGVALAWPLAGLGVLAINNAPELLLSRRAPADYHDWS